MSTNETDFNLVLIVGGLILFMLLDFNFSERSVCLVINEYRLQMKTPDSKSIVHGVLPVYCVTKVKPVGHMHLYRALTHEVLQLCPDLWRVIERTDQILKTRWKLCF